ncbi:hypothetical protein [Streptomyces decoyicus]|uniref:hypothetical protein n=1 Tax=Streptomyces decoyicus TaxID=249567 RepID=UPI000A4DF3E1|nr:hypothetical protein [Streptomyces decoyicus]QZY16014.1 hypothetical protein K7C20_12700 [Streptomyces decoyicus]
MCNTVRRLGAATGVLLAACALPIVATAPAQATTKQCESFLAGAGYKVGPKVHSACKDSASGGNYDTSHLECVVQMVALGIRNDLADIACTRAKN